MTVTAFSSPVEAAGVASVPAAKFIGVSPRTLWSLTAPRGPIPVARVGRRCVYRIDDLRAYLSRLAAESTAATSQAQT